jgi:anti-sigma B factor antagonist
MSELRTNSPLIRSARTEGEDVLVASVAGEIDLKSSDELREALFELLGQRQLKKFVLNLKDVPYMDSSGIAVLVQVLTRTRKTGGVVFLTNVQKRVEGILSIAKLNTIFRVMNDESDALGA